MSEFLETDFYFLSRNSKQNEASMKPDSFTFSILISSLAKQKKVDLAEKMCILALKDCGRRCEIMVYQPLMDAYGQSGDILNCLKLFNLLLATNTTYDLNALCGHGLEVKKDKLFKQIKRYNEKLVLPPLNAMCFNAVFKGMTRMKQSRFDKLTESKVMANDEELQILEHLLVPSNSWKIIDYLLNVMAELNINRTSVTYGILFHSSNHSACFRPNDNEERDGLQNALRIYKEMRNDKNMEIRTDLEMCNLLRTALSVYRDEKDKKMKQDFVCWWVEQMDDMNLKKSDCVQGDCGERSRHFSVESVVEGEHSCKCIARIKS